MAVWGEQREAWLATTTSASGRSCASKGMKEQLPASPKESPPRSIHTHIHQPLDQVRHVVRRSKACG